MIIFTVTNTLTHQIYVGSTRNDLEDQWEKMVAAAEQDLDYPLYRDIRRYGTEIFHREVYDIAENRSELAQLEQNAVDELDAISLRGHKTSTVIIKKKAPVRRKASDAEKELLDLLDSFATDELIDELPIEEDSQKREQTSASNGAVKSNIESAVSNSAGKQNASSHCQVKIPDHPLMTMSAPEQVRKKTTDGASKFDALAAAKAIIAQAAKEEEAKAAAAKAEAEAAVERSKRASRTNGNVSIDLNLDDSINAQLAAITAAIDGVLAGDTSAASGLETLSLQTPAESVAAQTGVSAPVDPVEPAPESESAPEQQAVIVEEPVAEPVRKISAKEQRIIDAVAHHRAARAQRSGAVIEAEIATLKAQLEELNEYILAMPASHAA